MRILLHAPPLVGHVMPMLPLARAWRSQGHELAWATGPETQALLEREGFAWHSTGPNRAWAIDEMNRHWPERFTLPALEQVAQLGPRLFAGVYAPATQGELLGVIDRFRPDLLLHDVMAHAAPLAATLRGVHHISHGFGLPRPDDSIAAAGRLMAPLWRAQGLEVPHDSGNHVFGHVDICPPSLRQGAPLPPGLVHALSPTPGVQRAPGPRQGLVATFGTLHNRQPVFERLLHVLAASPWPARVALGRALPDDLPLAAHVELAPWLDLAAEWRRCRVGACHAGAGTAFGALAQGVPLLLLPVAADQFRNAKAVTACGAALALLGDEQTPAAIRQALERLHDEPAFTEAALALADEFAGMPQADTVARALLQ